MKYLSAFYRQQEEHNSTALVLQQLYHRRTRTPVLLACVCASEGREKEEAGHWITQLLNWFYETGLGLCRSKSERNWKHMEDSLEKCCRSSGDIRFAGILCAGNHYLLFCQGRQQAVLLNSRYGRANCRNLSGEGKAAEGFHMQGGIMQKGIGILLATAPFPEIISPRLLKECLNVKEIHRQNQLEKRLRELGALAEREGGRDMGAVMFMTE